MKHRVDDMDFCVDDIKTCMDMIVCCVEMSVPYVITVTCLLVIVYPIKQDKQVSKSMINLLPVIFAVL